MEAVLIEAWLDGLDAIRILDDASVAEARRLTRDSASAQGLPRERAERLTLSASELARNALVHARHGFFAVRPIARSGIAGVEIICADAGAGIVDPTKALEGRARSSGSLGVGIASARENADEIDFDVRLGEGTCVRARAFSSSVERRREVGIYGRPHAEESRSGDHAAFHRSDDDLLLAICDGLGHGHAARVAAGVAIDTVSAARASTPAAIMEACHRSMSKTRGGVVAIARLREPNAMEVASVGNITVEVVRPRASRRFAGSSFVVGAAQKAWRSHGDSVVIAPDETIVMFSDGIPARTSLGDEPDLLREHPIAIAHQLVEQHGRDTDDVLVLVAR